ncbi:DUF1513 domain-containing protein [Hahella sp. KA22]|uniref:DUF1513 domain-containing protein n=1 Tax=Hahella sp. KA22 TaxID=1628392 RepID=UPI0013E33541|nr:DUF1513 domain-containing protein [Hahella sp. KA22]
MRTKPNHHSQLTLTRRQLARGLALGGLAMAVPGWAFAAKQATSGSAAAGALFSSVNGAGGDSLLILWSLQGDILMEHALPGRGHGVARHPSGEEFVLVGRRPARFAAVVRRQADGEPSYEEFSSAEGRHFFGHACYSRDGRYLYTTENDYASGRGVIGVRDAQDGYRQVGEWSSGGIGPHELRLSADGKALVVANGGILTHPDNPREKLNPDAMEPSLAYIDIASGELLERWELEDKKLSIRHLDVADDGTVCFGCQYEGPITDTPPLVYMHKSGSPIQAASAEYSLWRSLKNYTGSVVINSQLRVAGITSPRGDSITLWNLDAHKCVGKISLPDVCGLSLTPDGKEFLASSGEGEVIRVDPLTMKVEQHWSVAGTRWDNHMTLAG